jgi:hypothetical protein
MGPVSIQSSSCLALTFVMARLTPLPTQELSPQFRTIGCETDADLVILRKEVIQPQVPLRLPCYDLVPIAEFIFGA